MRVLLVNKYHYIRGGAERYYFNLSKLFTQKGHGIAFFAMRHKKNRKNEWGKYFADEINFHNTRLLGNLVETIKSLFSSGAYKKIDNLLDLFKPDIVHIHGIYYHIPASIIKAIRIRKIPIIYTVHDYHLTSSDVNMYYKNKNPLILGFFWIFMYINKLLWINSQNINYFLAPSKFMRKKLIDHGYNPEKVIYIPNFTFIKNGKTNPKIGGYVLFFGQLLEHKGVQVLIKAAAKTPTIKYKIAGDGRYKKALIGLVRKYKLKNVEFVGKLEGKKLEDVISRARFCVLPSLWPETFGLVIIESFSFEKTIIASKIGGIPEIVENGKNGLLFKAGDSDDLVKKILLLWNNPKLAEKLGREGLKTVKEKFSPDSHYKKIMRVYNKILNN